MAVRKTLSGGVASLAILTLGEACGADPPPPVVTVPPAESSPPSSSATAPTTTKTNPPSSDAPPDPPHNDRGDRSDVDGNPRAKSTCDTPCRGSLVTGLDTALQKRAAKARRCYDSALATDPTLKGKVVIEVLIAKDGGVCATNIVSAAKGMEPVATCVGNLFQSETYPAPTDGCISVKIPVTFVPKS